MKYITGLILCSSDSSYILRALQLPITLTPVTYWPIGEVVVIYKCAISEPMLQFICTYKFALRWMPQNTSDDKSTLVWVMASYHQARSHYINQCWLRSIWPYGITRPQWVQDRRCFLALNAQMHWSTGTVSPLYNLSYSSKTVKKKLHSSTEKARCRNVLW